MAACAHRLIDDISWQLKTLLFSPWCQFMDLWAKQHQKVCTCGPNHITNPCFVQWSFYNTHFCFSPGWYSHRTSKWLHVSPKHRNIAEPVAFKKYSSFFYWLHCSYRLAKSLIGLRITQKLTSTSLYPSFYSLENFFSFFLLFKKKEWNATYLRFPHESYLKLKTKPLAKEHHWCILFANMA